MSKNPLSIIHNRSDNKTVSITLIGDLDSEAGTVLAAQKEIISQCDFINLEVEFSQIKAIDGAGLKHLEIFLTQTRRLGIAISAQGLPDEIRSVFVLTKLHELISFA